MGFQTFANFDSRWGYNQVWHDIQDESEERYQNVIAKNHEIKIATDINNIYLYTRSIGIDQETGENFIEPYLWYITKNGIQVMTADPDNPTGPEVKSTIYIKDLDVLLRSIYATEVEIPVRVTIN